VNGQPTGAGLFTAVSLDGVRASDMDLLASWMNDVGDLHLWSPRRKPLSYEDMHDFIRQRARVGLFAVMRHTPSGQPVGFVDGNFHERDCVGEIEVFISPELRERGAGRPIVEFIGHMFVNYPLRSLFAQVYEYNITMISLLQKGGFQHEGSLRDYVWWQDRYWDVRIYRLDREVWENGRLGRIWRHYHN
jgi:RimJ/RimL family protein N-acetyltransferase